MSIQISTIISQFIAKGEQLGWIHPLDKLYITNRLLQLLKVIEYTPNTPDELPELLVP